ncbi:MAG: hypothetical protein V1773_01065 [bacterium]
MTAVFEELNKTETAVQNEYNKILYNSGEKIFTCDMKDTREMYLSFLSGNNFSEAYRIEKTKLKRIYLFEYEKRREILNNKMHSLCIYKKQVENGR